MAEVTGIGKGFDYYAIFLIHSCEPSTRIPHGGEEEVKEVWERETLWIFFSVCPAQIDQNDVRSLCRSLISNLGAEK